MNFKDCLRPLISTARRITWMLTRLIKPVTLPVNVDEQVLVHLGCGPINAAGYINIDAQPFPHVHYVHDVYPLEMLSSGSVNLIYASHVLEHFPQAQIRSVLEEWKRVLKPGGILRLGVPDFSVLAEIYRETGNIANILGPLLGGQTDPHNFHYSAFDGEHLTELLRGVGFREIRRWDPMAVSDHEFQDTTSNVWRFSKKDYPISLNIEAIK